MSGLDAVYTTDRVAFSAGSGDGTLCIMGRIRRQVERSGEHYRIDYNASDAAAYVELLAAYCEQNNGGGLFDWAAEMLTSIGETLNVELI